MGSWAQDGAKPLRNAGSKSKVQFRHRGRSFTQNKEKTPCWKTKNNLILDFLGFYKRNPFDECSIQIRIFGYVWNDFAFGMTQEVDDVAVIINRMLGSSPVSFRDVVFDGITRGIP